MSKMTDILVIDDEQVVREGVCRVCEADGLSIDAVGDAMSGLERLRRGGYRLVLCDIMLPDFDGFHILNVMRQEGIKAPLIMITGCSTLQNAVNALRDGAIDFIPKPFTVDELESGIKRGLAYQKMAEMNVPLLPRGGKGTMGAQPCPAEYYRLGGLSWVSVEKNGIGLLGVTDLFMRTVGLVKTLTMYEANHELVQAAPSASVESADSLHHQVLSPISGRIVRRNDELLSHPEALAEDPYRTGWLYQIVPSNLGYELKSLIPCSQDL